MIEIQMVWMWLQARTEPMRQNPERGDIVQTAIMIGLFAAGAIVVVGLLVAKARSAADAVKIK